MKSLCLGIDLGTSNSAIGLYCPNTKTENPRLVDFLNAKGFFPSIVSVNKNDIVVGNENVLSGNTIYNIKRIIGLKKGEGKISEFLKTLAYNITFKNNYPYINENYQEEIKEFNSFVTKTYHKFRPEAINAYILGFMKEKAQGMSNNSNDCVICFPANYNETQKNSIRIAAQICGLNIIKMISEPVAACINLAYQEIRNDKSNLVIVYDFGAGTLDVSLVDITNGVFSILATDGDPNCGGIDVDQVVYEYVIEKSKKIFKKEKEFLEKIKEVENGTNMRAKRNLINKCEEAKIYLSASNTAEIDIGNCIGFETEKTINIGKSVIDDYFNKVEVKEKITNPLKSVINKVPNGREINKVVFVGGTTNIGAVRDIVNEIIHVGNSKINRFGAVAKGAALYGAVLSRIEINELPKIIINEITPMSIKIKTKKKPILVIEKNTKLPTESEEKEITFVNANGEGCITIIEGDYEDTENEDRNHVIGEAKIKFPPGTKTCIAKVNVDVNMNVSVSYKLEREEEWNVVKINRLSSDITDDEIEEMKKYYKDTFENEKEICDCFFVKFYTLISSAIVKSVKETYQQKRLKDLAKECRKGFNENTFTKEVFAEKIIEMENKIKAVNEKYKRPISLERFLEKQNIKL